MSLGDTEAGTSFLGWPKYCNVQHGPSLYKRAHEKLLASLEDLGSALIDVPNQNKAEIQCLVADT